MPMLQRSQLSHKQVLHYNSYVALNSMYLVLNFRNDNKGL